MKLSIITVCFNSQETIIDTINSVNSQNYKNIEHIFVDGGSKDNTLNLIKKNPNKNKKIIIKKNSSIYEAMNEGIKRASGDIIQILNSDDILFSNTIIKTVITRIKKEPKIDIFLGNVIFFSHKNFYNITRHLKADKQKIYDLKKGDMPPHPSSFIRKKIYNKFGLYNIKYKIAADFDFFLRVLSINKTSFKILNINIVKMRSGGASNKNLASYFKIFFEILDSLKNNKQKKNYIYPLFRGIFKLKELIIFDRKNLNREFEIFLFKYREDLYNDKSFKIIKDIKYLNLKKNFILSGMNLAFLGYYSKGLVYPFKDLYHWPDGVFTKKFIDVKKMPGRDLIRNLKIPNKIRVINIIGNLSKKSMTFMKKKFNKKINHIQLPYKPIKKLVEIDLRLKKNEITFITLPTPKQELVAHSLSKKNNNFKIICIGGSISIASGEEKSVPNFLNDYEFLWRLKTDFFRRIFRLFETLILYIKGNYFKNLYNKTIFKIIDK